MLKNAFLAFFNAPSAARVRTRLRRLFFNSLLVTGSQPATCVGIHADRGAPGQNRSPVSSVRMRFLNCLIARKPSTSISRSRLVMSSTAT